LAESRAFTALVNPIAGGGKAVEKWAPLAAKISSAGADVRVELTRRKEHGIEAAREAAAEGRVVVAVGGDGLVRDVAEGVASVGGTLGVVPAGRGNDMSRALNLPADHAGLADLLLNATPTPMDVIDVDGVIVPGNVYCGIDSVTNVVLNENRWIPGALLYRLAPVRVIATWRAPTFTLTIDGERRVVTAHSVVVGNSGRYGRGLQIVPSARLDDGLLDVLIVKDGPRRAVVSFMNEAKQGTHVNRPEVEVVSAREITIESDRPLPVGGDGETLQTTPAHMRIRPAALWVLRG